MLEPSTSVTTFGDSLIVTYDATQGVSGLVGASKVYFHSGAELVPFAGWQLVVGSWGMDNGVGEMQSIGQNLWQIKIHLESYYGIPTDSTLNGIFMVFRNADGSQTGKDDNDSDIWMDMTSTQPTTAFSGVTGERIEDGLASMMWFDGSDGLVYSVSATGQYWVTLTDTNGCVASDTINITQSTIPLVDLGQPVICDGQAVTLNAGLGFSGYAWSTGSLMDQIQVTAPGTYSVTVTDPAGCTGIDYVVVPAYDTPNAAFSSSANGLQVTFTDASSDGSTYAWDFNGDGTFDDTTPGNTSFTYNTPGSYTVKLVVSNPCGTDSVTQTILLAVSAEEALDASNIGHFRHFPNPAQTALWLDMELKKPADVTLELRNLQGQIMQTKNAGLWQGQRTLKLNVENLSQGLYILNVIAGDERLQKKFIVTH
ncbi:MAG: T9SS type A sorting domain-containing protein [Bacteroidota bacterium]